MGGNDQFMMRLYRTIIAVFIGLFASVFLYWHFAAESAPKLANYYLRWEIRPGDVAELAKWDLLVLDMETQVTSRSAIAKIRELNPQIKILAYVTAQEIRRDAKSGAGVMRGKVAAGIPAEWYLSSVSGHRYSFWPGTDMLNTTSLCPQVNGQNWDNYLANFIAKDILSTGLWDGVFYDNTWGGLTWFTGKEVDINGDGVADGEVADASWRTGMRNLFNETRQLVGNQYILVGNAVTEEFGGNLNGMMLENFNQHSWTEVMNVYKKQSQANGATPRVIIINANTANSGNNRNYRAVRFSLASTLLGDGYFSYDQGDTDHGQVWWYDEYDINLGDPMGDAQNINGAAKYSSGVWRRDYVHGLTIVNTTNVSQTVDLGADYEKIIGKQDPAVNDGSITDKVTVASKDGLLMLKAANTISNIIFRNGDFLRFVDMHGQRVRNGFFVFEDSHSTDAQIWHGDLNGEAGEEKMALEGGRMQILNSQNGFWYNDYPFGIDFAGQIEAAFGEMNNDTKINLLLAPSVGGQVSLYNYYGGVSRADIYPLGKKFKGGFSVAVGKVVDDVGNAVLGVGRGWTAEILVYDNNLGKIRKRFFPYEKNFIGGVYVACGDVNGDGKDEIITAPMSGRAPLVRVFDGRGRKLAEFFANSTFGRSTVRVAASDVNFDGRAEIVLLGR